MPLEFRPPSPADRLVRKMTAGRLGAGSFTDDTEMALALADSLLERSPLDGSDLAARFVDWYRGGPADIGGQTSSVLHAIKGGQSWEKASAEALRANPDSAGNGSVMRCWPAVLKWWQDERQLAVDSALQSQVTHPHADCVAGSIFINAWIAGLIQGKPLRQAFQQALEGVEMAGALRAVISKAPERWRGELMNSGWVRHTLETAAWAVLTTDSFEEAVVQAANLGNDADTGAAVTGAVAGAAYGLSAIPLEWRSQLHGEWPLHSGKFLNVDDFIGLALLLADAREN
jgi:ADP-ribosyl-[dinitrogen reductase] hydrolase